MPLTRRTFFHAAGATAVGSLLAPYLSGRGLEARTVEDITESVLPRPRAVRDIRLNSNENPNGPGKLALDAVGNALDEANRYPHSSITALRDALAAKHGVRGENVVLGCGSTDILRASVYAFCGADRALVTASPSFESPPGDARKVGAPVREVPVTGDLRLDLDRMAAAAKGAGLVYLCNPNNPTSTVLGAAAVNEFVARLALESPATSVLIDEAYHEYVDDPAYRTAIPLAMGNPRVVVARTFSKVFGMAGMRVGYAVGDAQTMKAVAAQALTLGVNHLAAFAAGVSLADAKHIEREQGLNRASRAYTLKMFRDAGYKCADSQANFVMIDLRRDAQPFRDACRKDGVLVGRPFPPLDTYVRISIGTMDEMQRAGTVFMRAIA